MIGITVDDAIDDGVIIGLGEVDEFMLIYNHVLEINS
jgi:hypothetical protein